jgi:TRAP-type mannitol/chloroaromatic compound transport system substrate-binding protein
MMGGGLEMSSKMKLVSWVMGAMVVAVLLAPNAVLSAEKVFKWKLATAWPAGIPLYTDMAEVFAKNAEAMSGGRLKILWR